MPEQDVTIVGWPAEPVTMTHGTDPERPPEVDMNMHMRADRPVPVCFTLCEPICARSDYTIGLSIFDNPVVRVRIVGETRVQQCGDQHERPPARPDCVDFAGLDRGTKVAETFQHDGAEIRVGSATSAVEVAGTRGLLVPPGGLQVTFPEPITSATVRLVAKKEAGIEGRAGDSLVTSVRVDPSAHVQQVDVPGLQLTTIAITGEGTAVVEVCGRRSGEQDLIY